MAADVSDHKAVDRLVETVVKVFGGVDVMVNNVGQTIVEPAEDLSPDDWQHVIDVNLSGTFYGA